MNTIKLFLTVCALLALIVLLIAAGINALIIRHKQKRLSEYDDQINTLNAANRAEHERLMNEGK